MRAKRMASIFSWLALIVCILGTIASVILGFGGGFLVFLSYEISVAFSTLIFYAVSIVFDYLENLSTSLSIILQNMRDKNKPDE